MFFTKNLQIHIIFFIIKLFIKIIIMSIIIQPENVFNASIVLT